MSRALPWVSENGWTSRDKPDQPEGDADFAALISASFDGTWTWTVWDAADAVRAEGSATSLGAAMLAADLHLARLYPVLVELCAGTASVSLYAMARLDPRAAPTPAGGGADRGPQPPPVRPGTAGWPVTGFDWSTGEIVEVA